MISIFKREFYSYFHTMTGFVFIAFMCATIGIYFMAYNLVQGYPYFSVVLASVWFIFLIGIPFLTMRSFAEERHAKTDQLLLTSPISISAIVIGKYLAMAAVFALACFILGLCPLIIKLNGTAYLLTDYAALLAFFIEGCLFIAIGMMISACCESQILAAVGTFLIMLLFLLWDNLLSFLPTSALGSLFSFLIVILFFCWLLQRLFDQLLIPAIAAFILIVGCLAAYLINASSFESAFVNLLGFFSFSSFLDSIAYTYLIHLSSLAQVISLTVFFLFLTIQILNRRRWC